MNIVFKQYNNNKKLKKKKKKRNFTVFDQKSPAEFSRAGTQGHISQNFPSLVCVKFGC